MKHKLRYRSFRFAVSSLKNFNYEVKKIIFNDGFYWLMYRDINGIFRHIEHY